MKPARTETYEHTVSGLLAKRAELFNEAQRIGDRLAEIKNDVGVHAVNFDLARQCRVGSLRCDGLPDFMRQNPRALVLAFWPQKCIRVTRAAPKRSIAPALRFADQEVAKNLHPRDRLQLFRIDEVGVQGDV
jgi:hypothetical protein